MGSKLIGVRVPDDLAAQLEQVASENGQTTSEYVRNLLDEALYPSKSKALSDNPNALFEGAGASEGASKAEVAELAGKVDGLAGLQTELSDNLPALADRVVLLERGAEGFRSDCEAAQGILASRLGSGQDEFIRQATVSLNSFQEMITKLTEASKTVSEAIANLGDRIEFLEALHRHGEGGLVDGRHSKGMPLLVRLVAKDSPGKCVVILHAKS